MAPTPKDDPKIADAWKAYHSGRLGKNPSLSLQQVCLEIAERWKCSVTTPRIVLDPAYATRQRESARLSGRRRYARKTKRRKYQRAYRRLTRARSQERIVEELFAENAAGMTIDQITEAFPQLQAMEGVKFFPSTIETRLLYAFIERQQAGTIQGPPWLGYDDKNGIWTYTTSR